MIIHIGVDVSKEKLDIYYPDTKTYKTIRNNTKEIYNTFKKLGGSDYKVILEATGKYHRNAHRVLEQNGFKVAVVNPFQARNFARAMNLQCKTDTLDAKVLSLFGATMPNKVTKSMSKQEEVLQELVRHLDDLKKTRKELKCRKHESKGFVSKSLEKTIKALDKEIKSTENELNKIVSESADLQRKSELLESIPGVGKLTAVMLISLVKELGELSKTEVASLTGLAPMNWDSGKSQGKRRIGRGRHDVRRHLYMPILGAVTKHNEKLKVIYKRMVDAGKPKMVAITACMRKLVVWANAILATGKKWDPAVI